MIIPEIMAENIFYEFVKACYEYCKDRKLKEIGVNEWQEE